jgi:hypothetical protein
MGRVMGTVRGVARDNRMYVEYVRVPYWRALRPRWVWLSVGFSAGFIAGVLVGIGGMSL